MKKAFSLVLSAGCALWSTHPALAQDGFGGTYQSNQPQQWQPLAPQQGYGQSSQPAPAGGAPPYQSGANQQSAQQGTYYGYASQQQQQPNYQQNYQQNVPGLQGQGNYPQFGQPVQQQQGQQYYQQVPQNGQVQVDNNMPQAQLYDSSNNQNQEPKTDHLAGLKKAGKIAAGVGIGVGAAYMLNKAMNRSMPYGGGYPAPYYPPAYSYPYGAVPPYAAPYPSPYGYANPASGLMNLFRR